MVSGYKINMNLSFLYINNEIAEREIKKTILFIIVPKGIKYLGLNLTKEVKDWYSENYKILMKKIKDDATNGKISHAHRMEEPILFKYPYYPKQYTDLMQSSSKHQ